MAEFFTFPITDNDLKTKVELGGESEVKISTLDRKVFLKYYPTIIPNELIKLFKTLDLDALKNKNKIEKRVIPKSDDPCYITYEMTIKNNTVVVSFRINTRTDIKVNEEDECGEYGEFWTFILVKDKLKFKEMSVAG